MCCGTYFNTLYAQAVTPLLFVFLSYFTALSEGEPLPVKDRLEISGKTQKTDNELTPGLLEVLHKQVGLFQVNFITRLMFNTQVLNTYMSWKYSMMVLFFCSFHPRRMLVKKS